MDRITTAFLVSQSATAAVIVGLVFFVLTYEQRIETVTKPTMTYEIEYRPLTGNVTNTITITCDEVRQEAYAGNRMAFYLHGQLLFAIEGGAHVVRRVPDPVRQPPTGGSTK